MLINNKSLINTINKLNLTDDEREKFNKISEDDNGNFLYNGKPVTGGATEAQATQIEANKTAIGDENSGLIKEVNDLTESLSNVDAVSLNGKKFSEPMTKAEYDAIVDKEPNTIYLVDDDTTITGVPDYSSSDAGKVLAVNSSGTALEYIRPSTNTTSTNGVSAINEFIDKTSDTNIQFLLDVDGNNINCHGCGILYHKGVYYAYGESKTGETTQSGGNYYIDTSGVNCYSSIDLVNWKFENKVLKPDLLDETSLLYKTKIVERPKVIYNEKNDNFVMVWHSDVKAYGFAKIGFAVCDTPTGDFTILDAKRPTTVNTTCRDLTLFKDDDGSAYIFVAQDNNTNMYCHKLNDDYTDFTDIYSCVIPNNQNREAPAVFKHNSKYYIVTSGLTGWNPNPTKIYSCDTIMGTYTLENDVCKNDTSNNSYGSQPTFVIDVKGKNMNCDYILCFDQWVPTDLETSTYLWLPLFMDEADNKFYVDNTNRKVMFYNNDLVYKQSIISDTSSIFYGKTINSCLTELYNMIMGILNQKVESVSIDPKSYSLGIGKTKILAAELLPTNGVYKKITWSSNNEHVSITPNGKLCTIEGISEGSSTITVNVDGLTATSAVTVISESGGGEVNPDGLVFKINTNSLNDGKLIDLSSGLVAVLNGSPSISGNAIDFTGSAFSFNTSSLNLKDFTLKIKYTPTAADTGNIITLGSGNWANSFTCYQKDKLLFNCGAVNISNTTVGTNYGATTTPIGEIINLNELNEIVISYADSTRSIYVWLNGSLIQDGTLSTINIPLSKLCNTEGNTRYSGSYSLIEIFNKAYNSYSLIP